MPGSLLSQYSFLNGGPVPFFLEADEIGRYPQDTESTVYWYLEMAGDVTAVRPHDNERLCQALGIAN